MSITSKNTVWLVSDLIQALCDLTHLLLYSFPDRSEGSFTPIPDSWLFEKVPVVD